MNYYLYISQKVLDLRLTSVQPHVIYYIGGGEWAVRSLLNTSIDYKHGRRSEVKTTSATSEASRLFDRGFWVL